jgi:hypothetical protein
MYCCAYERGRAPNWSCIGKRKPRCIQSSVEVSHQAAGHQCKVAFLKTSQAESLPSLPSTVTWSLTLLALCACSYVVGICRRLGKENSNAREVGRRPPSSSKETAARSGLRIVFRCGSGTTSNNGSPVLWDNWNPKKESIPSIAAASSGLDRLNRHPVIQTLLSRLPHAGGPGPRAEPGQDAFSAAARKASKSAAAACAIA